MSSDFIFFVAWLLLGVILPMIALAVEELRPPRRWRDKWGENA